MKNKNRYLWLPITLFTAAVAWSLVLSTKQLRPLIPLYKDAQYRQQVQSAIQTTLDRKGILASSVRIDALTPTSITLSVREYRRGRDPRTPLVIPIPPHVVNP